MARGSGHRSLCHVPRILVGSDTNKGVNGRRRSCAQAPLGRASPDTVMIYAKLYPSLLIEEYRKTGRSLYHVYYGEEGLMG
jgi:hypothetical protein